MDTVQEFIDATIDAENSAGGSIHPGICGTCSECQSDYGMEPREFYHAVHIAETVYDEGGFSYHDCECCGSDLGGDRYAAHSWSEKNGILHWSVCSDCVLFLASGEVPYHLIDTDNLPKPTFDRFDIAIAHYLYCRHYNLGQIDWRYERLCKISKRGFHADSDSLADYNVNVQAIYYNLVNED